MDAKKKINVLVIDAQGGGLGRQLVSSIKEISGVHVMAVGTNTVATSNMLKAGADEAATGENSVIAACRKADFIIGPLGIVIADAMLGEITPKMANAAAQSAATRILIPFSSCDNHIVGVGAFSTGRLIDEAVNSLKNFLNDSQNP